MNEATTPEAQAALAEHKQMTRAANGMPPSDSDWATNYHRTVRDLRATLMEAALFWEDAGKQHSEIVKAWHDAKRANPDAPPPRPDQAEFTAHMACTMAGGYAYALAALLKAAENHLGAEVARSMAFVLDELLENGDFEALNADVTPAGRQAPAGTQGIVLMVPPQSETAVRP